MTTAKKKAKAPEATKKAAMKKAPSLVEEKIEYQIGIRELRQDASRVIELVEAGASITITRHGKVVATINPPKKTQLEKWIEEGAITPAKRKIDLRNLQSNAGPVHQEALDRIRRERELERF